MLIYTIFNMVWDLLAAVLPANQKPGLSILVNLLASDPLFEPYVDS